MTSRAGAWLPVALLMFIAGITFWLNQAVQGTTVRKPSIGHDPDIIINHVTARQLAPDGSLRYTLAALKMVHYPDDDASHLERVRFESVEHNQPPITIESDQAVVTSKGDEVFFSGNVLLVREPFGDSSRLTVRTNYLHVTPDLGTANTNQAVVIEDPNTVIHANSLAANNKTRVIQLTQVKAVYAKPNRSVPKR